LALYDPENEQATLEWAFAVRRAECIEAARQILDAVVTRLLGSSLLQYELARCECQLGELEKPRNGSASSLISAQGCDSTAWKSQTLNLCGEL